MVTVQSGFPFTPQLSYHPSNNGDTRNPVRPFVNPAFQGPVILGSPRQWFDPAAFLAPPKDSGFYGNLGFRERLHLQFRAEVFNALNRVNFNKPNAAVFTPSGVWPTAGVITSTATTARQIQVGLKQLW